MQNRALRNSPTIHDKRKVTPPVYPKQGLVYLGARSSGAALTKPTLVTFGIL